MRNISLRGFLGRILVLAGGTSLIILMFTTHIDLIWWVLAGIPTAMALMFYVLGRESKVEPLVAERRAGPIGRVLRLLLGGLVSIGCSAFPMSLSGT